MRGRLLVIPALAFAAASCGAQEPRTAASVPRSAAAPTELVGGLDFSPTGRGLRRQCASTAREIGFPVLCPGQLPADSESTPLTCRGREHAGDLIGRGCLRFARWQFSSIEAVGPDVADHIVFQAAPRRMPARRFVFHPDSGRDAPLRSLGRRRAGAFDVRVYAVGEWAGAALQGHTVYVWHAGGRTYGFGAHRNRRTALAVNDHIARHLTLVGGE